MERLDRTTVIFTLASVFGQTIAIFNVQTHIRIKNTAGDNGFKVRNREP